MCPEGFCDSERRCICTDTISNVGEETSFVRSLERDLRVKTGHPVCAVMQADKTLPVRCLLDRKVKKWKDGSGDFVER